MPGTVADGPTVSLSCMWTRVGKPDESQTDSVVANNFWGKEDAGVQPLLERMHNAKVTCDELKSFYSCTLVWRVGSPGAS